MVLVDVGVRVVVGRLIGIVAVFCVVDTGRDDTDFTPKVDLVAIFGFDRVDPTEGTALDGAGFVVEGLTIGFTLGARREIVSFLGATELEVDLVSR